jgi:glycosyltransferase involved in cell wall biosynthesis
MQELFQKNGIVPPCRLLWLFDYLTEEVPNRETDLTNSATVAFAGNLDKSLFLNELSGVHFDNIHLHLYGKEPQNIIDYPKWIKYVNHFRPDNVTILTEGWGLTWDGDSIEGLFGHLGNYMKYNSSHKTSLYIAAGIPVILSKEAALAEFVEKNKLGITVSSLLDIEKRISELSKEELQFIRKNVAEMSSSLRSGKRLGSILEDIVKNVQPKLTESHRMVI